MIAVILFMFVAGICLSQAASDPNQVTLRWLRLGGIIALSLAAITGVFRAVGGGELDRSMLTLYVASIMAIVAQLIAVQLAHRKTQRIAAAVAAALAVGVVSLGIAEYAAREALSR